MDAHDMRGLSLLQGGLTRASERRANVPRFLFVPNLLPGATDSNYYLMANNNESTLPDDSDPEDRKLTQTILNDMDAEGILADLATDGGIEIIYAKKVVKVRVNKAPIMPDSNK